MANPNAIDIALVDAEDILTGINKMANENHSITKPNQKPPTQLEVFKKSLHDQGYLRQVQNYYGGSKEEALRFMTAAVDYVRRVPKLLECDQTSLAIALVQSAQFRFMPSGVMGEAYIIPYGNEAKFQLGYQGLVTLLYRTNKIAAIAANIVYENDQFEYEEGLNAKLIHKPTAFGKPKGDWIGVYTIAEMINGAKTFKVMDRAAVMGIKGLSKAKNSAESPWNSNKDPELWMPKKTCLIQHTKLLPKTQELQQAIDNDYEGEGSDRGNLDAGGPAVGKASHAPSETMIAPTYDDSADELNVELKREQEAAKKKELL